MDTSVSAEDLAAGQGYEALFVPALFAPWPPHVLDAAGVAAGMDVLDVACGTGVLARHALARTGARGSVTGLDALPGMLAVAREVEPGVGWSLGRAETLPFDDAAFDAVVSQFGMMFFQDRPAAWRQMLRVLRPGGTLAVALWSGIAENPVYAQIVDLLEAEVGPAAAEAVKMPFSLGDPAAIAAEAEAAGVADVQWEVRQEEARFPSPRVMVEAELRGWLPVFGIHLDEAKIAQVLDLAEARLADVTAESGEAVFAASGYVVRGRKPG